MPVALHLGEPGWDDLIFLLVAILISAAVTAAFTLRRG
jgi:hypothetical protein